VYRNRSHPFSSGRKYLRSIRHRFFPLRQSRPRRKALLIGHLASFLFAFFLFCPLFFATEEEEEEGVGERRKEVSRCLPRWTQYPARYRTCRPSPAAGDAAPRSRARLQRCVSTFAKKPKRKTEDEFSSRTVHSRLPSLFAFLRARAGMRLTVPVLPSPRHANSESLSRRRDRGGAVLRRL
jgi:hypothetical protein